MNVALKQVLVIILGLSLFIGGLVACTKIVTNEMTKEFDFASKDIRIENKEVLQNNKLPGLYQFQAVEVGMTVEEIEPILGKPFSVVENKIHGRQYEIMTYTAKGDISSSITITLIDGIVELKEQVDVTE